MVLEMNQGKVEWVIGPLHTEEEHMRDSLLDGKAAWVQLEDFTWKRLETEEALTDHIGSPRLAILDRNGDMGDLREGRNFAMWLNLNRPEPSYGASLQIWETQGYDQKTVIKATHPYYIGTDLLTIEKIAQGYEFIHVKEDVIPSGKDNPHVAWARDRYATGKLTNDLVFRQNWSSGKSHWIVLHGKSRGKTALSRWKARERRKRQRTNAKVTKAGLRSKKWNLEDIGEKQLGPWNHNPVIQALYHWIVSLFKARIMLDDEQGWIDNHIGGIRICQPTSRYGKDAGFKAVFGYLKMLRIIYPNRSVFNLLTAAIHHERKTCEQPWRHSLLVPSKNRGYHRYEIDQWKMSVFSPKVVAAHVTSMIPAARHKYAKDIKPYGAAERFFKLMEDYYLHLHNERTPHYEDEVFKWRVSRSQWNHEKKPKSNFHERKTFRKEKLEETMRQAAKRRAENVKAWKQMKKQEAKTAKMKKKFAL